ncbi:MAG: hypothetical protein MH204_02190, partial [Fimbriimonadaceae bacterium]|nr:hypothetical protein [Fimbriimonadaceae bacterium]
TMALALLFGFSKRRSERLAMGEEAALTRPALAGYSGPALDALVVFSGGLAALSYGVYAIQSATALAHPGLILTAPFVLYGVARYLQMSFSTGEGQEPDVLIFTDRHLVWSLIGFFGTALLALGGLKLPFVE